MIDTVQYRFRIGTFLAMGNKGCKNKNSKNQFADYSCFNPYNRPASIRFKSLNKNHGPWMESIIHSPSRNIGNSLSLMLYSYIMTMLILVILSATLSPSFILAHNSHPSYFYVNWKILLVCISHIKIG